MLGVSVVGLMTLVIQKIPVLVTLPETHSPALSSALKRKTKKIAPDFSGFSFEKFLHKALSKSKIFVLRAEHKIDNQLKKLRHKNKPEKKNDFKNDEYWDKLKKGADKDDSE